MKYVGKIGEKEVCSKTYWEISGFFKKILAYVVVYIQTLIIFYVKYVYQLCFSTNNPENMW